MIRDLVPSIPVVGKHSDHAMAAPGSAKGGAIGGGVGITGSIPGGAGEFPGETTVADGTTWVFPDEDDDDGEGEAAPVDLEEELGGETRDEAGGGEASDEEASPKAGAGSVHR